MKEKIKFLIVLSFLAMAAPAFAIISINSRGTSLAPVPAGTSTPVIVIPGNVNRISWSLMPEGGDVRCTAGTYNQGSGALTAPATPPSTSVGFLFKSNVVYNQSKVLSDVFDSGPNAIHNDEAKLELDCVSVSGTVNVDTWEALVR